jgi:hypothetical protein
VILVNRYERVGVDVRQLCFRTSSVVLFFFSNAKQNIGYLTLSPSSGGTYSVTIATAMRMRDRSIVIVMREDWKYLAV